MGIEVVLSDQCDLKGSIWRVDKRVARLAASQHGVVSLRQVRELGLSEGSVRHRLRSGRLHPVMRGVYAVGHNRMSAEGRWMAAVLAYPPRAVLSHRSAAALLGILETARERIEITVGRVRARPGIQPHCGDLEPHEVMSHRGIPVTTPTRTLADLAGIVGPGQLRRALEQAEILRLLDIEAVRRAARGRRGATALVSLIEDGELGARRTRSELEERFLDFLRESALPLPETNVPLQVAGRVVEVDCLWRGPAVVVELDGHGTHHTRRQFEEDRERDRALAAVRMTVVRITWRQIHERPQALESDLRTLLRQPVAGPPGATPPDRFPCRGGSSRPPRS